MKVLNGLIFEKTNKRRFLIETVLTFIAIGSIGFGLFYIQTSRDIDGLRVSVETSEYSTVEFQREYLENEIDRVQNDLLFISKMKAFNDLINDVGWEEPYDRTETQQKSRVNNPADILRKDIGFYMGINDSYEEIIYADENGNEVFHLNRIDERLHHVPEHRLSNISKRNFFPKTMSIAEGNVYQTPMNRIILEASVNRDFRPRIIMATKVVNALGEEKGVLAISYNTSVLLKDFERIGLNGEGHNLLLNAIGETLTGSINGKSIRVPGDSPNWGHFDKNEDVMSMIYENDEVFVDDELNFEIAYESIEELGWVQQDYFDWGLVTAVEIGNEIDFDNSSQWYAISIVPCEYSSFFSDGSKLVLILGEFTKLWPFGLPVFIVSWGIATIIAYRRKFIEEITEMAQIDGMTGAFNRNAGTTMLDSSLKYATSSKNDFTVCFVDVNDLKKVNDELGHEMGDEYLIDAVKVLKSGFREADHLVRLGGDEFVIGVQGDAALVDRNWHKILNEVDAFNIQTQKPYKISLSHGVASFHELTDGSIEDLIALADERMYVEKKRIKANRKKNEKS